jgi:hypothetical protein
MKWFFANSTLFLNLMKNLKKPNKYNF